MEKTQKPLIIYHDPCDDGFGAALAAWLKFGDEAEYCGRNYNLPNVALPSFLGRVVYILDFSFKMDVMRRIFEQAEQVIWLDHHKSAFDMWCGEGYLDTRSLFTQSEHVFNECSNPVSCTIVLDNNKSGAILAWEHFHHHVPRMIRFIDDNDRWEFMLDGSVPFRRHLYAIPMSFESWSRLAVDLEDDKYCAQFIKTGEVLGAFYDKQIQDMLSITRREIIIPGFDWKGLSANASGFFANEAGHILAAESGTFALVWEQCSDGSVGCSLRSSDGYDVLPIAKHFGGGGNKGSAGFRTTMDALQSWFK